MPECFSLVQAKRERVKRMDIASARYRMDKEVQAWECALLSRRRILQSMLLGVAAIDGVTLLPAEQPTAGNRKLEDRARGLLTGTLFGDALGGPIEFQDPEKVHALLSPPKKWLEKDVLNTAAIRSAGERIQLRSYKDLRPVPEPYGQWSHNAPAGTITDDSRHKIVLLESLRQAEQTKSWPLTTQDLARTYLEWSGKWNGGPRQGYDNLCSQWLEEYSFSARWVLGERDHAKALPTDRLWVGLPTCCGQMGLLPLAIVYAGKPEAAYLAAYSLAFFDNSWGRDMNAALVAGLAHALVLDTEHRSPRESWKSIIDVMRTTDPYRYSQVPWSERAPSRWLDFAINTAKEAEHFPARCFKQLEEEFKKTTKWEAHVCLVIMFASLELCDYDPLAAMQLSIEWGHDTDSYAQLLGAFVGAIHGPNLFPRDQTTLVVEQLKTDYAERLDEWVELLVRLNSMSLHQTLIEVS